MPRSARVEIAAKRIRRFAFSIHDGKSEKVREKRRRAVADYVLGWLESADIVDEWPDDDRRWLSVAVRHDISVDMARKFAEECPHYVRRSFAVDKAG